MHYCTNPFIFIIIIPQCFLITPTHYRTSHLCKERGQPVEKRSRAIGALLNKRLLDPESNLCFGEGGAGTWSDGKLTTGTGKNSPEVRWVMQQLVNRGAPERILVDGKPHLGTDKLVTILKVRSTSEIF